MLPTIAWLSRYLPPLFSYKQPPIRLRSTAWLDGLRGIAALEVVIFHYAELWGQTDVGYGMNGDEDKKILRLPLIRTLYCSGPAMVCLFFVISGLVLTQRVLKAFRDREMEKAFASLASSVFRRGLRLFIPAIVSAFIAFLLYRWFNVRPYGAPEEQLPYYDTFLEQLYHFLVETVRYVNVFEMNLRDTFMLLDGELVLLGHRYANVSWTIPTEFWGSMASYLELIGLAYLPVVTRNVLLILISFWALLQGRWVLVCFNSGICLGDWLIKQSQQTATRQRRRTTVMWVVMLICGIWLVGAPGRFELPALGFETIYFFMPSKKTRMAVRNTVHTIGAIFITTSCSQLPTARAVLESGFSQYLGKVSFSVYLMHIIVRDVIGYKLQALLLHHATEYAVENAEVIDSEGWVTRCLACVVWFAMIMPVVFIVSGIFEAAVDAPLIKFSRWVEHKAKTFEKEDFGIIPQTQSIELEAQPQPASSLKTSIV